MNAGTFGRCDGVLQELHSDESSRKKIALIFGFLNLMREQSEELTQLDWKSLGRKVSAGGIMVASTAGVYFANGPLMAAAGGKAWVDPVTARVAFFAMV